MANTPSMKFGTSKRFVTVEGVMSYPHVFEPSSYEGSEPKYSCSILVPKEGSDSFIEELEALQDAAIKEAFGDKVPRNFQRWGITDGDEKNDPTAHGNWIIKAANKQKPKVVDSDKNEILDKGEIYGGAYCRMNLQAFSYGNSTQAGVTLQLLAVQKTKDGQPFGGAAATMAAAIDDF